MKKTFSFGDIESGQIFQMGFVVPDIESSVRASVETMGIGPFTYAMHEDIATNGWYRGSSVLPSMSVVHAFNGQIFTEYIQQHDDTPSVYTEYTKKYGYGLHHFAIAIAPEDYDKTLDSYYSQGLVDVYKQILPGGARIRYVGPETEEGLEKIRNNLGVGFIECVELTDFENSFFTEMYKASLNWDGKTLFRERETLERND